ncbi:MULTISPECIES: 1,4-alpha-glucan branching protein domain-containing protein [unclassified Thermosipho (in: thermotogales)]|uniref:glycoside hydrolase family 57 protein n=1 Tax=unclassified Thermosipho (in: thermotogales) TaxID=2676525 RepID=UPI000985F6CF|nr:MULTISPECIES: 1,4-alpha-glucan branching protein domain-containing protein [unclassified Thermosipho (in: thermotogales)]MBT1247205.1 glycoside hydrolase [Thermosipho sp. 1244]OOC47163.1 glycoside hydrolase [Thermosipho sp. 1223]
MPKGNIVLVLHAHLPFIHHPDHDFFLEENWLFEAITETYIPLLRMFRRLEKDNIKFNITMSITPPLMEMLANKDLQEKYIKRMNKLIELAEKEVERTKDEHPKKHKMAKFYLNDFKEILYIFKDIYKGNILNGFKEFLEKDRLDIITCNATHGFLPFMEQYPQAIRAQLEQAVKTYERHLGRRPRGIWLAESAYFSGLDKYLEEYGIEYFFVDSHGFWYADERPKYGVYRPVITPNNVFVFARDPESSEQVWSAEIGYPGDGRYREFYRDIGFDREFEYIKSYIDPSGVRTNTGIKYHKITSKDIQLNQKDFYDIDDAKDAAKEHALDFLRKKEYQSSKLLNLFNGLEPIIVAPFDAELFGHWWFEGPIFLEEFMRYSSKSKTIRTLKAKDVVDMIEKIQIVTPATSTWGANGYNEVWLNGTNDWIYPHLHEAIEKMTEAANLYPNPEKNSRKMNLALNQMARELMLAQSSDWAFIMTTQTSVEYAVNRTKTHLKRFLDLYNMVISGKIDMRRLSHYSWLDDIFPDIDYTMYLKV